MVQQQRQEDSSRPRQRDSLRLLPRDWSLRLALRVGLPLEVVREHRVLLAVVAVVAQLVNSWRVLVVLARRAVVQRQPDSSAPEHLDSYLLLSVVLVRQAELVQAKPTRTRVNRDR